MVKTICGILGGGQLGKYLIDNNKDGDLTFAVYSPTAPLVQYPRNPEWTKGDLNDQKAIIDFGLKCDIITIEIENVSIEALLSLKAQGKRVIPDPDVLNTIKNKLSQKLFLSNNGFPTPKLLGIYHYPDQPWTVQKPGQEVHKLQVGGYDGRGVIVNPKSEADFFITKEQGAVMVEEKANIAAEISIVVGRNEFGDILMFEPSQMIVDGTTNMLDSLVCPPVIFKDVDGEFPMVMNVFISRICDLVIPLVETMKLVGLLAIELFVVKNDPNDGLPYITNNDYQILINEISPRPHNSGHHTMDRYNIGQDELLRMILLGKKRFNMNELVFKSKPDINVWYESQYTGRLSLQTERFSLLANINGSEIVGDRQNGIKLENTLFFRQGTYNYYWYGKHTSTPGRKMGHITHTFTREVGQSHIDLVAKIDSEFTRMKYSTYITLDTPNRGKRVKPVPMMGVKSDKYVAVIMGSNSDLPTVYDAIDILNQFRVPYKLEIVSAHRTPHHMLEWARSTDASVIIAAAGGAAHLPGMIASATTVPVVGIPINSHNSIQGGTDSLLSICQMPMGVPVGTMAVNGAANAALYAIRMLSIGDMRLKELLQIYATTLQDKVAEQNSKILPRGSDDYIIIDKLKP